MLVNDPPGVKLVLFRLNTAVAPPPEPPPVMVTLAAEVTRPFESTVICATSVAEP